MSPSVKIYVLATIIAMIAFAVSCKKSPDDGNGSNNGGNGMVEMTPYEWISPYGFDDIVIPEDNKLYVERIALGKQLFYDNRLSNNGESCNTCHVQSMGFAAEGLSDFDHGQAKMPLMNLAWHKNFMWSGRVSGTLEHVMEVELTKRFSTDINKINAIADYRDKFRKYYGVNEISVQDLSKALAQFMRILVSKNTKYEKALIGQAQFTFEEMKGREIFFNEKGDCFHCHVHFLTTDDLLHNNGLDSIYTKEIDKGYFNVSGNPSDLGKFRTPNLRNVALRTSYMHDGRFKTLEEVIEFYDHQSHRGIPNIDPNMVKSNHEYGLGLTEEEKRYLVAFLKTFTDTVMVNEPMFRQD